MSYGIVLMHGTYPWSYDAAKILFDPKTGYTQAHGFRLGTVEDVICWKYGKHSWELIAAVMLITSLPVVVLFIAFQRQFIEGLLHGSVKG